MKYVLFLNLELTYLPAFLFRFLADPLLKYDIAFLGYTYKPNSSDIRESPAKIIINEIQKYKFNVYFFDPLVDKDKNEDYVLSELNNSLLTVLLVEHEALINICNKINFMHWKDIL